MIKKTFASTRRTFVQSFAGMVLPALSGHPFSTDNADEATRWETMARRKLEMTKDLVWTSHEPIAFLMRRGEHFDNEAELYDRMYDPENLKRMAAAGVRYGRLYFYKGFGRAYERPAMEKTIRAAEIMHGLGMKVALYIGGTMFIESLYREVPEAKGWEQRDQYGRPVSYGNLSFRHFACPNEPAYREYLKPILKSGALEAHADEISFDNVALEAEPKSCRCHRCILGFHEFLKRRYPTREQAMRRFGLPDTDWIEMNEWDSNAQPGGLKELNDPVLQEWVRFRCESLANYANSLSVYIKSLNPKIVLHLNIKGFYSYNRYWTNAIYHPLFAGHVDVLSFDTGGYEAHIDAKTGALISQIRSYKVARRIKASCEEVLGDELRAAVHMAFGYQTPISGYAGAAWNAGAQNVFTAPMEFFREYNDRYFRGTESVADVAVVHNWPSMAYSISSAYVPTTLTEQVLIQYKIPFDLLFDEQMDRMGDYKALILAGQECMSNAQVDAFLKYVHEGGVLIVTDNTAQYNEWREERHVNPLLPAGGEGKGKIVYIPQVIPGSTVAKRAEGDQNPEPGFTLQPGTRLSPPQWLLPRNHEEIHRAIAGNLPGGPSFRVEAPLTTVMELLTKAATRETIAHFINFDTRHPVEACRATIRKQFSGPVKSATSFTFDRNDPAPVKFEESGEQINLLIPATRLYTMIVLAQ